MRIITSFLFAVAITGCAGDHIDDDADAAGDHGEQVGEDHGAQTDDDFGAESGDAIVAASGAIVFAIDDGQIRMANLALARAADPDVTAYAQSMIDYHESHIAAMKTALFDLDIEAEDNRTSDSLRVEVDDALVGLETTGTFDYDFMRMEITMHAEAGVIVGHLEGLAPYDTLARFFGETRASIAIHRNEAVVILREKL